MSDVKYNAEELQQEAQVFIDKFRAKFKDIAEEELGNIYTQIMPYIETDTWTNYREALRIELEHEYKYTKFKDEWATNFRRAVFVENRVEIAKLIEQDILKRIKHLEDCKQEFDMFRYSPGGDNYQEIKKARDEFRTALEKIKKESGSENGCAAGCGFTAEEALARFPKEPT